MSYVLILLVLAGSGTSVSQHEYRTESTCTGAGRAAQAEFNSLGTKVKFTCQPIHPKDL